jgi:exo-beta-1,3-glucanase (GH17 family)
VDENREEQERAVEEAAREERAAWKALERAMRPEDADEPLVRAYRDRWKSASRSLVEALESLKAWRD